MKQLPTQRGIEKAIFATNFRKSIESPGIYIHSETVL